MVVMVGFILTLIVAAVFYDHHDGGCVAILMNMISYMHNVN